MPFEKYEPKAERLYGEATIHISDKVIMLNAVCTRRYFEGKEFVELYFDKAAGTIGLRPMKEKTPSVLRVRKYRGNSPSSIISALGFFRLYGILDLVKTAKQRTFEVVEGEKGMLEVRLK